MIFYKKLYYKKKIRAISDEVKRQICEWGKANKNKHHVDITNHFNEVYPNLTIDRSTISKILLQSDKWTAIINTEDSKERTKLQQLLSRYILDQIYNIDETGLFYRMSPSQTLSTKPVPGRKKDKTRITVLLGANATGTDKLKPWVIGNAKRPRPLSKVNLERLPVFYRGVPDFPYEVFRITGN
ncbi:unnamed protein product [Rhizophagus irregularis]|nr:unnamed protein product [Rhizophagus irregularis]